MPQFIQNIHIENFKSAKNVRFEDCKRINLLIGKPNVGKSNLLEALSIFCLPFLKYLKKKDLQQFVRVENISELFCNGNVESDIQIQADEKQAILKWVPQGGIEVSLQYFTSGETITLPFQVHWHAPRKIYRTLRIIRFVIISFLHLSVKRVVCKTSYCLLPAAI